MAQIVYEQVSKVYYDGTTAVRDLDLAVEDGELMVMVGPSGCGKTTALRMLAGLEEITDGEIIIGDRVVNDLTPKERDIAMVFQNYALYPHMTVAENLAFGLKLRKLPKSVVADRVKRAAEMLEIEDFLGRKPKALSGGQRQRVAMGRAIVREPQAFLMDEPLSNLDAQLRVQMRAEIHHLQRRLGVTTIYVTHDQVEAMTMGDRVAVLRDGRLQQVDTPQALYDAPVNEFVAGFIGSPSINLVEAQLERTGDGMTVSFFGQRLTFDPQAARNHSGLEGYAGRSLLLGIRPEDFEDAALARDTPPERRVRAECRLTEPLGADVLVHFAVGGVGATLIARVSPKTRIAEGTPVELAVDTTRLYFFDLETRKAI